MKNIKIGLVFMAAAFILIGCNDGTGNGDPTGGESSITLSANGGASRSISIDADGGNIDGLIFSSVRGFVGEWGNAGQVFTNYEKFYESGGILFNPTEDIVHAIDDTVIPDTVDIIIFEMCTPTVSVGDSKYGQATSYPVEKTDGDGFGYFDYTAMDHISAMRIVDGSGNVLWGDDTDYSDDDTNGDDLVAAWEKMDNFFFRNYVIFVNPEALNDFTDPICGIVNSLSGDMTLYDLDGVAYGSIIQNLIDDIESKVDMMFQDGYVTILPMFPTSPWDDGIVEVTLTSDFSSLLSTIWENTDTVSGGFDFTPPVDGTYADLNEHPVYDWKDGNDIPEATTGTITHVVDFETGADGQAIDWSIAIE